MTPTNLRSVELQFMQEWEGGKQPTLQDYVARYPGYARDLLEFVADYVIFEAVAPTSPATRSIAQAGASPAAASPSLSSARWPQPA